MTRQVQLPPGCRSLRFEDGTRYVAEREGGAFRDGIPLRAEARASKASQLRGAVLSRFLDATTKAAVERNRENFGDITAGRVCAGVDYPAVIEGEQDFVLFWRTLPWDHAAEVLLAEEAGGLARRPDGSPYRPGHSGVGLLVEADTETWHIARQLLD